jgi:DNA-binding CsgD family transcriptional regulator/tetratricopeptide (TPR) repeat protein
LLAHLDHPLQFLTMGSRSAPPRQQTLRHTIAWSYALLSQEEQTLFRRLCVFVGGWTLPAVEAIVSALSGEPTDAETGLAALLDKNLILLNGEVDEQPRFQMLETIRAFGLECLEASGEGEQVWLAHAQYYLSWAESARRGSFGREQGRLLRRYVQEQWNWRSAMRFFLDQHDTEAALALAGGLSHFMLAWGMSVDQRFLMEGRDFLEQALSSSAESASPVRVSALSTLGGILGELGEFERGAASCRAALTEARSRGDAKSILMCLWMYSRLLILWDDLPALRVADEEALTLSRAAVADPASQWDDLLMLALTLRRRGHVALWQGRYAQAREQFEEALTICIRQGEQYVRLWFQLLLGEVDFFERRDEEARELLEEVIRLYQALGVRAQVAEALGFLGLLALRQGDVEGASARLAENVRLREAVGDERGLAWAQIWLARAELARGNLDEASRLLFSGLAQAIQARSRLIIAMGLEELGKVAAEQGELIWAVRLFGSAEALREAMEAPLPLCEQPVYEQILSTVRVQLGAARFRAVWAEGKGMTPQQVLESPHEAAPETAPTNLTREQEPPILTGRERDVLQLLAQGRTNAQIAERLVVSPFTVKAYVRAIYRKLGVDSRAAATRFALDHHLL